MPQPGLKPNTERGPHRGRQNLWRHRRSGRAPPARLPVLQQLPGAAALNLVPATFLENNGSTSFFRLTDGLLVCGPTGRNVNGFMAILAGSSIRD